MKKYLSLLCIMALLAAPLSDALTEEKYTTTVMVYMCGSNLESQYGLASADIAEMMGSGLDRFSTNVVLMTGGAAQWAHVPNEEGQSVIYQLRGNRYFSIWQGEQKNMGDGDTLSFFLNTAYQQFQTDRYMLIFWNHGGGPIKGVCWDENFNRDSLEIPELLSGIENSPFKEKKLDLIGFDACLMGSLETAWQLSPYAHLMIASEETEPGGGWDYSFLKGMEKESLQDTAKRIIDLYIESAGKAQGAPMTLSCIDLAKIGPVTEALNAYFTGLNNQMDTALFQNLSNLRYYAQGFGRDWRAAESTDYDLVDIMSLLNSFQEVDPQTAEALRKALQEAILYHRSTYDQSFGLSIYFPYFNSHAYELQGKTAYEKLNFCPGYTSFIDTFHRRMQGDIGVDYRNLCPVVVKEGNQFNISLQLTEAQKQNMVSARLVIFDSNYAPGSQNAYFDQVYGAALSLSPDNKLQTSYQDECLIFEYHTQTGLMRRSASLPFTLLDSGEYRVEVMAANLKPDYIQEAKDDEPGVSHRMQFTLSPSEKEEGLMEITQIQAWDAMTQTFTSRTDDRIENYEYLYLMSDLKLLTREDGLILPFAQWDIQDAYGQGVYSSYAALTDSEWYFRILKETNDIRYAAFEITDIYNNTFTTELALIRPMEDVLLYHAPFELAELGLQIDCRIIATSPYAVSLLVEVTNPTDKMYSFNVENIFLNGQAQNGASGSIIDSIKPAYPGAMCSSPISFDIQDAFQENFTGRIDRIQLDLAVYEGMREKFLGIIENITLQPEINFQTLPLIFQSLQ